MERGGEAFQMSPEIQKPNPTERLLNDEHIKEVLYAEESLRTFEGEDMKENLEKIKEQLPEKLAKYAGSLVEYINSPVIVDTFEDHAKRREWEKELLLRDPEAEELLEHNRLGANRISGVATLYELYREQFPELQSEKLDQEEQKIIIQMQGKAASENEEEIKPYYQKTIDEKKAVVEEVTKFSSEVYASIAKMHQGPLQAKKAAGGK